MEPRPDLRDDCDLKRAAPRDRLPRHKRRRRYHFAPRRDLRMHRRQGRQNQQQRRGRCKCDAALHTCTCVPSCCETTRLITSFKVSPVFSDTKPFFASDHASLKLVDSAEIQISRTGVFGEITNLASVGSSKITSSFPASPSTSKPRSSPSASRRFFRSSNAASAFR